MPQSEQLNENIRDLNDKIDEILIAIDKQNRRVTELETRFDLLTHGVSSSERVSASAPQPPEGYGIETSMHGMKSDFDHDISIRDSRDAHLSEQKEDFEQSIGTKWFAWIGITALLLGIAFFIKYAFDNDWITEAGRVIIGVLLGFGLLAIGERLKSRYRQYSQYLTGGGFVTLYISVFGANVLYELIPYSVAFILMLCVTVMAVLMAMKDDEEIVMVVATVGGFLTPLVLDSNADNVPAFLLYVLLFVTAVLVVVYLKRWQWLSWLGCAGGMILLSLIQGSSSDTVLILGANTLFWIGFTALPLLMSDRYKTYSSNADQFVSILVGLAYAMWIQILLGSEPDFIRGGMMILAGVYYFCLSYVVQQSFRERVDTSLLSTYIFGGFLFTALAIPVMFDGSLITFMWLGMAVVALYLAIVSQLSSWSTISFILLALGYARLLFLDPMVEERQMVVLNETFGLTVFAVVITTLEGYLLRYVSSSALWSEWGKSQKQIVVGLMLMAHFLSVWGISREIVLYFDQQIDYVRSANKIESSTRSFLPPHYPANDDVGYSTRINERVVSPNYERISQLEYMSSITLSIFWLLYGIGLLFAGIRFGHRYLRLAGMALLLIAVVKLFMYDLWSLGTLYRIISSILIGGVLLGVSFNYHRYKQKIEDILA